MREGRFEANDWERDFYELALKVSGAVQAARWTRLPDGGFIHSFNGPHSLFVDTIRSLRSLALAHQLGHRLRGEQDAQISLLDRLVQHAKATAGFSVYYGRGRDAYDVRGRVAHEAIFNSSTARSAARTASRATRRSARGRAGWRWAMLGFAEQLEFHRDRLPDECDSSRRRRPGRRSNG